MMCKIDRQQDISYSAGVAASYFVITLEVLSIKTLDHSLLHLM